MNKINIQDLGFHKYILKSNIGDISINSLLENCFNDDVSKQHEKVNDFIDNMIGCRMQLNQYISGLELYSINMNLKRFTLFMEYIKKYNLTSFSLKIFHNTQNGIYRNNLLSLDYIKSLVNNLIYDNSSFLDLDLSDMEITNDAINYLIESIAKYKKVLRRLILSFIGSTGTVSQHRNCKLLVIESQIQELKIITKSDGFNNRQYSQCCYCFYFLPGIININKINPYLMSIELDQPYYVMNKDQIPEYKSTNKQINVKQINVNRSFCVEKYEMNWRTASWDNGQYSGFIWFKDCSLMYMEDKLKFYTIPDDIKQQINIDNESFDYCSKDGCMIMGKTIFDKINLDKIINIIRKYTINKAIYSTKEKIIIDGTYFKNGYIPKFIINYPNLKSIAFLNCNIKL